MSRTGMRVQRLVAAVILALLALVLVSKCATGSASSAPLPPAGGYTIAQLRALWVQGGGSRATGVNAACHAMQESSGNRDAESPNPDGGQNIGLWQLDTRGKGAGYTVAQLEDPLTNARAAVAGTDDGTDWSAWATPGC